MRGIVNADLRQHTLRSLFLAWQGKMLHDWDQTVAIMWAALSAAAGGRRINASALHPLRESSGSASGEQRASVRGKSGIALLAYAFLGDVINGP